MQEVTARFIQNIVENIGEEVNFRPDYSGRGMFGKTTYAVDLDDETLLSAALAGFILENTDPLTHDMEVALNEIQSGFHRDSMGRGVVIY